MSKKIILVTGASSGIGRSTAEFLVKNGNVVFGTSRKAKFPETSFYEDRVNMISLDVQDRVAIKNAVNHVFGQCGRLDVVVNNAGIGLAGSVYDTPPLEIERILRVNVLGYLAVIQEVLPYMLKCGQGLIINVSSLAGRFSLPYQGYYSATKFAIEAISESLSMELKAIKSPVKIVVIEPTDIATGITDSRLIFYPSEIYYRKVFEVVLKRIEADERSGSDPGKVARVISRVVNSKHPRLRYVAGNGAGMINLLYHVLPGGLFRKFLLNHYL